MESCRKNSISNLILLYLGVVSHYFSNFIYELYYRYIIILNISTISMYMQFNLKILALK